MNRFLTFGVASTLALASLAGVASAAGPHGRSPVGGLSGHDNALADPGLPVAASGAGIALHFATFDRNSGAQTDRLIRHWKGGPFDVVAIGNLDDTALKVSIEDHAQSQPRQVAALQSAIHGNGRLSHRLAARNVEIGNIVEARTAIDGGLTFYVR